MSRAVFGAAFAAALAAALWLRLADPAARPMHHDEANQAVRFGHLLEAGAYRYDPHDHHGPTLYYLTLPFAWARGQHTLAALDERTIRMAPALFGAGLLLLFLPLSRGLGRGSVAAAAALAALSPALVYYSRFYIQEALFTLFALGFLVLAGRYALRPRTGTALAAGVLAGLAFATKETAVIVLPIAALACLVAARLTRASREPAGPGDGVHAWHALAAAGGALVPVFLFYSAFFRHPAGVLDAFRAFSVYLPRGLEGGAHVQPWFYYLQTLAWSSSGGLAWSEALVLALATLGIAQAVVMRRSAFWPICLALYAAGTCLAFSAIPYKTPWNLLPFYAALVLLAGFGTSVIVNAARTFAMRALLLVVLGVATAQLGSQSVRASFHYSADERNPYAYAQTVTDYRRLVGRVHDLAAVHPDRRDLLVKVIAAPHEQWPFPWYARRLAHVGYWADTDAANRLDDAAIVVASQDHAAAVEAALGDRYVAEFYGLRPGVLLTLFIEPELWERFLASRR
jgi:uncharacterized protein (TIGR03663 family)